MVKPMKNTKHNKCQRKKMIQNKKQERYTKLPTEADSMHGNEMTPLNGSDYIKKNKKIKNK